MAKSVKGPTLGSGSRPDLRVLRSSPASAPHSVGSLLGILFPSPSGPSPTAQALESVRPLWFSLSNKSLKKKKKYALLSHAFPMAETQAALL